VEDRGFRIENCGVLQSFENISRVGFAATYDKCPAVWKKGHAVAEEVPEKFLDYDSPGDRVPHCCFVDVYFGIVSRSGDDQDLAGSQKPHMDGVDGHGLRAGLPLPIDMWLRLRESR
jgi:hypothetical protein